MDDVAQSLARERLASDLKEAKSLKELAWAAIQSGADPKYVAGRYGFSVEQMIEAKQEYDRREALKRERG